MAKANVTQIKGLIPLLDRKRVQQPFVVDGRNFYIDADGPISGFGEQEVFHEAFASGVVLDFNEASNDFIPVFTFLQPASVFPWTHATVGGIEYFARKDVGLLQFNTVTDQWALITGSDVPSDIQACAESGGRLIVAATGWSAWSAIDDGTDFAPSTVTGAGAQALGLIAATGADDIITVLPVAEGYLTITKNGIMRSRLVERLNPFQHTRLTEVHDPLPINPFSIIELSRFRHVFLAREGFFAIEGGKLTTWQPVMGEFFHARQLPFFDLDNFPNIVRLSVDNDRQWVIVSVATTQAPSQYNIAYVLYIPSDEWGVFNRLHSAFIKLDVSTALQTGFSFGFVDTQGSIFRFTDGSINNSWPVARRETYDYHANVEFPARREVADNVMPSRLVFSHIDEGQFAASGVYNLEFEQQTSMEPAVPDAVQIENDGHLNLIEAKGRNFALFDWFYDGTCINALNVALGYDGLLLADQLTDDASSGGNSGMNNSVGSSLPSTAIFGASIKIKKDFTANHFCGYELVFGGAVFPTPKIEAVLVFNPATGVVNASPILTNVTVVEVGDYWEISAALANDAAGNHIFELTISPLWNLDGSLVRDNIPTGLSVIVDDARAWRLDLPVYTFQSSMRMANAITQLITKLEPFDERGLDSYIEVGLIRFSTEDKDPDEMSMITNVILGQLDPGVGLALETFEDWLLDYTLDAFFDWLTDTSGDEDWGEGLATSGVTNYQASIIGTNDGYAIYGATVSPPAPMTEVLTEEREEGRNKFFTCDNNGLFHIVRIDAIEIGEAYHLKTMELRGYLAGRVA
jgi:hypothetical protein